MNTLIIDMLNISASGTDIIFCMCIVNGMVNIVVDNTDDRVSLTDTAKCVVNFIWCIIYILMLVTIIDILINYELGEVLLVELCETINNAIRLWFTLPILVTIMIILDAINTYLYNNSLGACKQCHRYKFRVWDICSTCDDENFVKVHGRHRPWRR